LLRTIEGCHIGIGIGTGIGYGIGSAIAIGIGAATIAMTIVIPMPNDTPENTGSHLLHPYDDRLGAVLFAAVFVA
jgi:hypothetical protein